MKKISLVVQNVYKNNKVFDLTDDWLNQDNRLDHVSLLRKELKKEGFDLSTNDINDPRDSFIQLHSEVPKYEIHENNAFFNSYGKSRSNKKKLGPKISQTI